MATCVNCGQWAGVFQTKHTPECPSGAKPGTSAHLAEPGLRPNDMAEVDRLVELLRPMILEAGKKAGETAAWTLIIVSVVLGLFLGFLSYILH